MGNKIYQSKQRKFDAKKPVAQYLAFMLGEDEFAIDILKIQEIKSYNSLAIEKIARAPAYFNGFTHLNETIVPIIDLRMLYGVSQVDYADLTVVILLNVHNQIIGVIVSSVTEINSFSSEQIKPALFYETMIDHSNVIGIGVSGDKLVTILDPDKIFTSDIINIIKPHTLSHDKNE